MKKGVLFLSAVVSSLLIASELSAQTPATLSASANNGVVTYSWSGATGPSLPGPAVGNYAPGRGTLQYKPKGGSSWQGIPGTRTNAGNGSASGTVNIPLFRISPSESMDSVYLRVVYNDRTGSVQSVSNELYVENVGFNGVNLNTISLNNGTVTYNWAAVYVGRGWLEYKPKGGTFWRGIASTRTGAPTAAGTASIAGVNVYRGESLDSVSFRVAYYRNGVLVRASGESYVENVGFTNKNDWSLQAATSLKFYPNPVRENLVIENGAGHQVSVFDLSGRLVMERHIEGQMENMDVSALPKGVYILRLQSNNFIQDERLIIE